MILFVVLMRMSHDGRSFYIVLYAWPVACHLQGPSGVYDKHLLGHPSVLSIEDSWPEVGTLMCSENRSSSRLYDRTGIQPENVLAHTCPFEFSVAANRMCSGTTILAC